MKILQAAIFGILLAACICASGCVSDQMHDSEAPSVSCTNGVFIGTIEDETGVAAFKGIPYAKQPVGELRWKAPQKPEASNNIYDASAFGSTALQIEDASEPAGKSPQDEDCLTLNIWTQDLHTSGKTVMVYFHGGAFTFGGTTDPLYNGQYLAAKEKDLVVVTCNYRINMMGYIDFSDVEGGEDFPNAPYNGVLDAIAALNWIHENIDKFGGDPDKITIFGESAGGALVACLLVCDEADGLFKRAILQSGDTAFTSSYEDFKRTGTAAGLMEVTNSANMNDLMSVSVDELKKSYLKDTGHSPEIASPMKPNNIADRNSSILGSQVNFPLRGNGSPVPENPYQSMRDGASKDVDIMIGTNTDEARYFINTTPGKTAFEKIGTYEKKASAKIQGIANNSPESKKIIEKALETIKTDDDVYTKKYPNIWKYIEIYNEYLFRLPAIKTAEAHVEAEGTGKTYMYLFGKKNPDVDWLGAPHAVEVPYVFNNVNGIVSGGGTVDAKLADTISSAWIQFALTGNPGDEWTEYNTETRATMFVGNDNSMTIINDPKGEQRELLMPLLSFSE